MVKPLIERHWYLPGRILQNWEINEDFLVLTDAINAVSRLRFDGWVPPPAVMKYMVRFRDSEADARNERRKD